MSAFLQSCNLIPPFHRVQPLWLRVVSYALSGFGPHGPSASAVSLSGFLKEDILRMRQLAAQTTAGLYCNVLHEGRACMHPWQGIAFPSACPADCTRTAPMPLGGSAMPLAMIALSRVYGLERRAMSTEQASCLGCGWQRERILLLAIGRLLQHCQHLLLTVGQDRRHSTGYLLHGLW